MSVAKREIERQLAENGKQESGWEREATERRCRVLTVEEQARRERIATAVLAAIYSQPMTHGLTKKSGDEIALAFARAAVVAADALIRELDRTKETSALPD
jgi:hypothetical protein